MGYEDVDVTLRLRAIDETDRVMADAARRAKSFTDAMVRGMSEVGRATLEASKSTQRMTEGMTAAGRATQQHTAAVNAQSAAMSAATKTVLGYAAGFLSVAGAVDTAIRGYKKFAESERDLERLQAGGRVTREQVDKLAHSFEGLARLTGRSVGEITQSFGAFKAQSGLSLGASEEAFKRVVAASTAAGTTISTMSRGAISALTNMKVPAEELSGVLDKWVSTIPSSMMDTWSDAAPRITSMLRSMGFTGTEAAGQIAGAFADLSQKMGQRQAVSGLESILSKAKDINSTIGMMSSSLIDSLKDDPDKVNKTIGHIYEITKKAGLFDMNKPSGARSLIQQHYQLDDRDVQTLEHFGERLEEIRKTADELGLSTGEVDRRMKIIGGGSQMVIDRMSNSFTKMYEQVGRLLSVTGIPNVLSQILESTATDIEKIVALAEKAQQIIERGNKPAAVEQGIIDQDKAGKTRGPDLIKRGLRAITPYGPDSAEAREAKKNKDIMDRYDYEQNAKDEEARRGLQTPREVSEKEMYEKEEEAKQRAIAEAIERRKREKEERTKTKPRGSLRSDPATEARQAQEMLDELQRQRNAAKPKMATGGEFIVPGSGRADDTPVSFMGTPGERVTVESIPAADTKESLQRQQDKADIALREHFARFHGKSRPGAQIGSGWPHDRLAALGGGGGPAAGTGTGTGPGGTTPGGGGDGDGKTPPTTQDGTPPAGPPTSGPGYNIGPYGQPMPEWGTHVTEGEDWGGGTGGGVAGGVPGLPGSPSGRALTKEERAAGGAGVSTGAAPASTGGGGQTGLAGDRAKFAKELAANPALREKVLQIANNEQGAHGQGTQAVIESMMNRASYAGRTLAQEARWRSQGGYYADGKKGSGMNRAVVEQSLANALGGGNVSNYATDNASTQWGLSRIQRDMYRMANTINKEYFSTPGLNPEGPGRGNYNKYQAWLARMKSDGGTTAAPAVAGTGTGTGTPATGTPATSVSSAGGVGSPITGELWQGLGADRPAYANLKSHRHAGFDVGAPVGTAVTAEGDGVVSVAPNYQPGAVGGIVTVKYKDGTTAKYMHLSKWDHVKKGQIVKAGDVIGSSGFSPGTKEKSPHLHVEYRDANGKLIDPAKRHGWGQTDAAGAGLRGRVTFAGLPGSYPRGTTRAAAEAAIKAGGGKVEVAGPTTATPATPKPEVPKFVPGRTQGMEGTPSGPAVRRPKGPDAPHSTTLPDHDPGGLQDATPSRSAASAASAARRTAAAKSIAAATPKAAADPAAKAIAKGKAVAGELAEGGTAGAGQDYLVGENGPEILSMGPRSGTVHHPGTGYTGPGAEFPEGHDPRAAGLQPGGVGPFGSDLDVALGFIPGGPATTAGKSAGSALLGKLGGIAGKFAGGQVEHQITREGLAAGGGVLDANRQFEDRLDLLRKGSSGSQIQPIAQAHQDMREALSAPIEPIIKPRIQQTGPLSMRWGRQSERQRHRDISADQARSAHVDQGFQ